MQSVCHRLAVIAIVVLVAVLEDFATEAKRLRERNFTHFSRQMHVHCALL